MTGGASQRPPRFWQGGLDRLGRSSLLSLLAVFALAFSGAALVGVVLGIPEPWVQDEFSYLLGADTFAHGRLSNPAHPLWEHFETVHVIQQPSYASKYQPAPALFMALGQRLWGHPIVGVWLGSAFLCASVLWMLQGCLRPRWALLGGVLTALQFGIAGLWAQSYWGGAVPAAGAALLLGGAVRLQREPETSGTLVLGLGLLLLAGSRPFEGGIVTLCVLLWMLRLDVLPRLRPLRLLPLALLGICGIVFLGVYNLAVTGDPLKLPYELHHEQYDAAPLFVFESSRTEPHYRHESLRHVHVDWEKKFYEEQRDPVGWLRWALARPVIATLAYGFGPPRILNPNSLWLPGILLLPVLLLPVWAKRRTYTFAIGTIACVYAALSLVTYFMPHYVAVLTGLWMYLVVQAARTLRVRYRRTRLREVIVPVLYALAIVHLALAVWREERLRSSVWTVDRDRIETRISAESGRHLVLVEYSGDHGYAEWVNNAAAIDAQDIVWAHSMGDAMDTELLRYFSDRTIWRVTVSQHGPSLQREGP